MPHVIDLLLDEPTLTAAERVALETTAWRIWEAERNRPRKALDLPRGPGGRPSSKDAS